MTLDREIPREVDLRHLTPAGIATITRAVFVRSDPRPSDLMLVFGATRQSGNWQRAAALIQAGIAQRVLVSGGTPYDGSASVSEAQGIRSALVNLGVPASTIAIEERSRNTLENVVFSRELLWAAGKPPVSIVAYCKSHHAGRASRTLVRHMPDIPLSCATYDASYEEVTVRARDWHLHATSTRRVLAEYERILLYAARGDIAAEAAQLRP